MKKSEIRKLIKELITEVGESNIEPIPYKKLNSDTYEFEIIIDNENITTRVKFTNLDKYKDSKQGIVPSLYKNSTKTFTVGFTVGGKMEEFKKTEADIWFKIMNTAIYLIKDFIKTQDPDVLVFLPAEKLEGSKKKTNIYSAYLKHQIEQFPQYTYEEHDIYTIIYKKY